eukprot:TRINITY_DN2712_c0_g1_i1.p1 TRINITY_DN2712_c0_g1~~TRINITY_DN2712_c0_g1_i1.p1  ORF type:complete len:793 (+),score=264.09 TRINITY_DN2712_c0_g1_i1:89-2467(+)
MAEAQQEAAGGAPRPSAEDCAPMEDDSPPPTMNGVGAPAEEDDAMGDHAGLSDSGSDGSAELSEDDYVTSANSFGPFGSYGPLVVIFGSRRKAQRRAKKKHSGTQWECEDCTQMNSILDNPCTACGYMDLDLLELGNVGWVADLKKQAEEQRKKEEEEKRNKEREKSAAERKQRKELEERLLELRRKMKLKEQLMKKEKGGESPQPTTPLSTTTPQGPKPPGTTGSSFPSASPPHHPIVAAGPAPPAPVAGPTAPAPVPPPTIVGTPGPAPKAVKSEGPALPPHLLAARRAREPNHDATPPRDSAPNILGSPVPKDSDRRDRRRRSDSEGRSSRRDDRREKDRRDDRDKGDRRRRLEGDPPRDRDRRERDRREGGDRAEKDRPSRRDDRRPAGGAMDIMKSILERGGGATDSDASPTPAAARLSGGKRVLSPENKDRVDSKVRKTDHGRDKMGRKRDVYSPDRAAPPVEEGPSAKREGDAEGPLQKRGRGASKWAGPPAGPLPPGRDRWEEYDERKGVAVVTSASGKKLFQNNEEGPRRAGPAPPPQRQGEGPMKRGEDANNSRALQSLRSALTDTSQKSLKEAWAERVGGCPGLLDSAEEIAPDASSPTVSKGVVHHLATDASRRPWVNPYQEGLINVSASTTGLGDISHVLAPKFSKDFCFSTSPATDSHKHSYVAFDFCDWEVLPYQYTLGHAHDIQHSYMRSWTLRASADNYKWDILSKHTNDETIKPGNEVASFRLAPQDNMKYYRYFMIRLDPKGNSRSTNQLIATCFELYGYLRRRTKGADKDAK